jgi:hypothetical protein
MRISALTFVVLAGTASVVTATPARKETTERISYSGKHAVHSALAGPREGWVELASATPASHGREFIEVAEGMGELTQLRVRAASGRPSIRAVRVEYKDGSRRTFTVEAVLGPRRPSHTVDLRGGREVEQVIVYSDRDSLGSYILEGNAGETGIASR